MAPNCTSILRGHLLAPVSLENVLDKAVKVFIFFYYILTLSTCLLMFCVTKLCIKHFCCRWKYNGCLEEKHLCDCLSCRLDYLPFPWSVTFTLENEWWTNCLFRLGVWQIFSQKWTKWACYFRKTIWHYLRPMITWTFKKNYNFEK